MKKTILMLFAVAIASVNIFAQETQRANSPKKSPEERAERITKGMTAELGLTPDQQEKAKALILSREQDREQGVSNKKAEKEKIDAQWRAILTPEQYQKFQQKRKAIKEKHEEKRKTELNKVDSPQPSK